MPKFCRYCGAPLKEGANYCSSCGQRVVRTTPQPVQPVEEQPQAAPEPVIPKPAAPETVTQAPKPGRQAPAPAPPKKKRKGGAIVTWLVVLAALAGGAWWLYASGYAEGLLHLGARPDRALVEAGYAIDLPAGSGSDIQIEKAAPEEVAEAGLIGQPVYVSRGGDSHVQLEEMARVSFPIPRDIPKKDYIDLMGVLVVDGETTYMVPDYDGIRRGVVTFETSHFCYAGMTFMDKAKRRQEFINRTAASEWRADASEKDLKKTVKETLQDWGREVGLGENDLMGMVMREVVSDNDFVNDALEMIEAYDESGGDPETMATKAAEKIVEKAREKALTVLFKKLKGDMEKDLVDFDPKSGKFIHTRVTLDGDYKDCIEALEGQLGKENMEELGTMLGKGDDAGSIAWHFTKKIGSKAIESWIENLAPPIKGMKQAVTTMKILKEFWASNEMNDMFETYRKYADENGHISDDDWNVLFIRRLNAAKSKFGMTEWEIRQEFEDHFLYDREIQERKAELNRMINLYEYTERYTLINARIFDKMGLDYIQRLTRIHMLVERFRAELVDKDGNLPGKSAAWTVDETLCEIVEKYLELYPDTDAFYRWLEKKGYYGNRYKKLLDGLDGLRSWWLVKTEVIKGEDDSEDFAGVKARHSASELRHECRHYWNGDPFQDYNDPSGERWYRPFTCTSSATISPSAPEFIEAGDSLTFHISLRMAGGSNAWTTRGDSQLYNHNTRAKVKNLVGSEWVGGGAGEPQSGEWDVVLYIGQGYKGDETTLSFYGCGSDTRWTYRWCTLFERDEVQEE